MAMTHRSDLTTEIENALTEEAYDGGSGAMSEEHFSRYVRRLAEAAVEVVTSVHTPTDDEREALRAEAVRVQRAAWAEVHGQDPSRTYSVAEVKQLVYSFDNVLSSALRRSEVPEPQSEPSDEVANAVARAIMEHDEERLTCYDHPEDFCCPCGEHGMSRSEWQRHRARAALRAAGGVR